MVFLVAGLRGEAVVFGLDVGVGDRVLLHVVATSALMTMALACRFHLRA
jgi:hypothetical protein